MKSGLPEEKRPTEDDTATAVMLLSNGETIKHVCERLGIKRHIFGNWMQTKPGFYDRIEKAREAGVDDLIQQCMDIADDVSNDMVVRDSPDGTVINTPNPVAVNRAKLRIETRLRVAKYLAPMKFAEAREIVKARELQQAAKHGVPDASIEARVVAARKRVNNRISEATVVNQ